VSGSFSNGVRTENVTITLVQQNDQITVTRSGGTETGQSGLFDVTTTTVDHFVIDPISSPQTAGLPFSITVTAEDANNNTVTDFNGTVSLSDLTNTIAPSTSGSFTDGEWTGDVTITESRTSNTLTVTGAGKSSTSNSFDVNPAALDHFEVDLISSPQIAGDLISVTMTAKDVYENIVTGFDSTANLSDNTGTLVPTTSGNFSNGVLTDNVTVTKAQIDVQITATSGSAIGTSNNFNVVPALVAKILIRNAAQGSGTAVGDISLTLDESITLYAAGYDQFDNFSRDILANWSMTGDLDSPSPGIGTFTVFDPVTPNTSGLIVADSTGLTPDSTGTITVGSIASIKIRDAANGLGNEVTNVSITADDSLTLFAAGYDAGNNFVGDVQADWSSLGLTPAISEISVLSVVFSPTLAPVTGSITAVHQTAGSAVANVTVAPGNPAGNIVLTPTPVALSADGVSSSDIVSDIIRDSDGNQVEFGKLITVSTNLGSITTIDASDTYPGIQVATDGQGKIAFVLQAGIVGGTANITAGSVEGSALGTAEIQITNLTILSIEAPTFVNQGQTGVRITMTVENVGSEPVINATANLTFRGPAPNFQNFNGDYSNRSETNLSFQANSRVPVDFDIDVNGSATTATVITVDGNVDGFVNSVPIPAPRALATDSLIVQTPANLRILSVVANRDTVSQGSENHGVEMTVQNTGEAIANIDSANLIFKEGASDVSNQFPVSEAGGNPTSISGGDTAAFNFVVNVAPGASPGNINLDGHISGSDNNSNQVVSDDNADNPDSWVIVRAPVLQITSLEPSQGEVTESQTREWYVWMHVRNNGGSPVRLDSSKISIFIGSDVTREYTIINPTGFWNNGQPLSTLVAGGADSLRFTIEETGSTMGTATIQGKLDVTDLLTNEPISEQTNTNPASVLVQEQARLEIKFLFASAQTGATAGQEVPWTVRANIQNNGESTIRIDTSVVETFLSFSPVNDFVVTQPAELSSGGFDLADSEISNLIFTINKTTATSGFVAINATIKGIEINSGRQVSDDTQDGKSIFVVIEDPPLIKILSTTTDAPNEPDINTGQPFQVNVEIANTGQDAVKTVLVDLSTEDGQSSIQISPLIIGRIAGGISGTASFQVTASENAGTQETFSATILSALQENTSLPSPILPASDSTTTINIERPAGLEILAVIPSDSVVAAGQGNPNIWTIDVVVQDTGMASLTFAPFSEDDIQFRLGGEVQTDYNISADPNLLGGDRILEEGETDTVRYTVNTTGFTGGPQVDIVVNLTATDDNDKRTLEETRSGFVEVKTTAAVQIIDTKIDAPHLLSQSNAEVNLGQTFFLKTLVDNKSNNAAVRDVWLSIETKGGSQIKDTNVTIPRIPPNEGREAEFEVTADSQENLAGEEFVVRVDSARSEQGDLPAAIQEAIDSTAIVFIEDPAVVSVGLSMNDADGVLSAGQEIEVRASILNSGRAGLLGTGRVELVIPENYELILPGDTSYVARDTIDLAFGNVVTWNLLTPAAGQDLDSLFINLISAPRDENTNQMAFVLSDADTLKIETLANEFRTTAEIISPTGATDGIVSTEQEFVLLSTIQASENFDSLQAELTPPAQADYEVLSPLKQFYDVQDRIEWRIRAPEDRDQEKKYFIIRSQLKDESGRTIEATPDTVEIETVARSILSINAFISAPPGAQDGALSTDQPFVIRAIVRNDGARVTGSASVLLELGATGVSVQQSLSRPFVFQPGQSESEPIDWSAMAPNAPTPLALISASIDTIPMDENSGKSALISEGIVQIQVDTEEAGSITNGLRIDSPQGAMNDILSTEQQFTVKAQVSSQNVTDTRAELTYPLGFFTENDSKQVTPGFDEVSWIVTAPEFPAENQIIKVQTFGFDAHDSQREIHSDPDSIVVMVQQRASVSVTALI
jgi:hypothetical protein